MIDVQDYDDHFSSIFAATSVTVDEAAASMERANQALDRFTQAIQSLTTLADDLDDDDVSIPQEPGRRINYCSSSLCPNEDVDRGRCQQHARGYHKQTHDKARAKEYASKGWRTFRRAKLALNPICEVCNEASANEVHHLLALDDGGEMYDLTNVVSCCKPCHSKQTWREVFASNKLGSTKQ